MPKRNLVAMGLALSALVGLGGCQVLGPTAINAGRGSYNDIIQSTSMNQTLANIVRVYKHEPTQFMDVTAVNASTSFVGSVNGSTTNIGARAGSSGGTLAGQVGSVGGTLQYSETPTITYTPLTGQALVTQLATPVSVDAIADLYDSYWGAAPVLDLATSYITDDYYDLYVALGAIAELDYGESIELVAGSSALARANSETKTQTGTSADGKVTIELSNKPADSGKKDTLILFFTPNRNSKIQRIPELRALHLWIRLLRIYAGTQSPFPPDMKDADGKRKIDCKDGKKNVGEWAKRGLPKGINNDPDCLKELDLRFESWVQEQKSNLKNLDANSKDADDIIVQKALECLPDTIELRTMPAKSDTNEKNPPALAKQPSSVNSHKETTSPSSGSKLISHAPLMRTYSALGILKNAVERPRPHIEFVGKTDYDRIVSYLWNANSGRTRYYTLLPTDEKANQCAGGRKHCGGEDNPDDRDYNSDLQGWLCKCTGFTREQLDSSNLDPQFKYCKWPGGPFLFEKPWQGQQPTHTQNSAQPQSLPECRQSSKILPPDDTLSIEGRGGNDRLGTLRRYLLIIVDDGPAAPASAYVSYTDGKKWYYIDQDDEISQKNFDLLTLFLTMMAIPSPTSPPVQTINVGG